MQPAIVRQLCLRDFFAVYPRAVVAVEVFDEKVIAAAFYHCMFSRDRSVVYADGRAGVAPDCRTIFDQHHPSGAFSR